MEPRQVQVQWQLLALLGTATVTFTCLGSLGIKTINRIIHTYIIYIIHFCCYAHGAKVSTGTMALAGINYYGKH